MKNNVLTLLPPLITKSENLTTNAITLFNKFMFSPVKMTSKDVELAIQQCHNQGADTPEEITRFIIAYQIAKTVALRYLELLTDPEMVKALYWLLAVTEDPNNGTGYRIVPVTFANGNQAIPAELVPKKMEDLYELIAEFIKSPEDAPNWNPTVLYKELKAIHALKDGNGRVGDLLWKVMVFALHNSWPETLPPEVF